MRIGFHKLGFNSIDEFITGNDKNGMFTEVVKLMNIFNEHGYDVEYVDACGRKLYHTIFIFNGYENSTSCLKNLCERAGEINYALTDSRFYELAVASEKYINNYFVQSPVKMFDKPTFNSNIQKLPLYMSDGHEMVRDRIPGLIFGGSVRERKGKVMEYIIRPNTKYLLRFEDLGIDTRVTQNEYTRMLKDYMYGVVLINPLDTSIGSITWRYYEYIANGLITFVDYFSDPNHLILPADHYLKVNSYDEMFKKQVEILRDKALYEELLEEQREKISHEDLSGLTFIKSLVGERQINAKIL